MRKRLTYFLRDESGSNAIEYGLIISLLTLGIIGSIESFGTSVIGFFNNAIAGFR